jgi:hypothetical protein
VPCTVYKNLNVVLLIWFVSPFNFSLSQVCHSTPAGQRVMEDPEQDNAVGQVVVGEAGEGGVHLGLEHGHGSGEGDAGF